MMDTNGSTARTTVGELLEGRPDVLEVLEEWGIRLDPWTMIALKCTLEELAEYSAIRHPEELRQAVERRLASAPSPPH